MTAKQCETPQSLRVPNSSDLPLEKKCTYCGRNQELINGKVWIQRDATEAGIADELEAAGIPKADIVLAFHTEKDRALIPAYAVA